MFFLHKNPFKRKKSAAKRNFIPDIVRYIIIKVLSPAGLPHFAALSS